MNTSPAFQFYPDDFLGGVADMTQAEVGAYILLLCQQWNRGSIPVQPDRLKLLAKGDVSEYVLAKFREGPDGLLRNERLEAELQKQSKFRAAQQVKGQKSGVSRRTAVEPRLNSGSIHGSAPVEPRLNPPISVSNLQSPDLITGTDCIRLIESLHRTWQERTGLEAQPRTFERHWTEFVNHGWRLPDLELVIEHSKVLNKDRDEKYYAPLALGKLIGDPPKFADRLMEAQAWEKAGRPLELRKDAQDEQPRKKQTNEEMLRNAI